MLLAFKPLEKNYGKQQWHMRFGRWGHYKGCLLFWDFTEFLSQFLQWVKALLLWEKLLHIVFWFKNATDISKEINTALCRFFSGSAFALILCLVLKELVTPRLRLTCDLVSPAIVPFTSTNISFTSLSSLCFFLRVFRSLLYMLSLKGILQPRNCFPRPQMYHPQWITVCL